MVADASELIGLLLQTRIVGPVDLPLIFALSSATETPRRQPPWSSTRAGTGMCGFTRNGRTSHRLAAVVATINGAPCTPQNPHARTHPPAVPPRHPPCRLPRRPPTWSLAPAQFSTMRDAFYSRCRYPMSLPAARLSSRQLGRAARVEVAQHVCLRPTAQVCHASLSRVCTCYWTSFPYQSQKPQGLFCMPRTSITRRWLVIPSGVVDTAYVSLQFRVTTVCVWLCARPRNENPTLLSPNVDRI